ncbi:hypothetical protein C1H46_037623 [Malus baccata]|uniref:Uncharacterized protein n=1 Tax=Malus baccata TaxID=106549 RepID=A0A540KRI7_MALBA|nr:hypothetical protein C1H46_037623 [Malus baccata]
MTLTLPVTNAGEDPLRILLLLVSSLQFCFCFLFFFNLLLQFFFFFNPASFSSFFLLVPDDFDVAGYQRWGSHHANSGEARKSTRTVKKEDLDGYVSKTILSQSTNPDCKIKNACGPGEANKASRMVRIT